MSDNNGWSEHKLFVMRALAASTEAIQQIRVSLENQNRLITELTVELRNMKSQMRWGAGIIASAVSLIVAVGVRLFFRG